MENILRRQLEIEELFRNNGFGVDWRLDKSGRLIFKDNKISRENMKTRANMNGVTSTVQKNKERLRILAGEKTVPYMSPEEFNRLVDEHLRIIEITKMNRGLIGREYLDRNQDYEDLIRDTFSGIITVPEFKLLLNTNPNELVKLVKQICINVYNSSERGKRRHELRKLYVFYLRTFYNPYNWGEIARNLPTSSNPYLDSFKFNQRHNKQIVKNIIEDIYLTMMNPPTGRGDTSETEKTRVKNLPKKFIMSIIKKHKEPLCTFFIDTYSAFLAEDPDNTPELIARAWREYPEVFSFYPMLSWDPINPIPPDNEPRRDIGLVKMVCKSQNNWNRNLETVCDMLSIYLQSFFRGNIYDEIPVALRNEWTGDLGDTHSNLAKDIFVNLILFLWQFEHNIINELIDFVLKERLGSICYELKYNFTEKFKRYKKNISYIDTGGPNLPDTWDDYWDLPVIQRNFDVPQGPRTLGYSRNAIGRRTALRTAGSAGSSL